MFWKKIWKSSGTRSSTLVVSARGEQAAPLGENIFLGVSTGEYSLGVRGDRAGGDELRGDEARGDGEEERGVCGAPGEERGVCGALGEEQAHSTVGLRARSAS